MLIQEKVAQAIEILHEKEIACWITFTRESAIRGDPSLDYLLTADVTWHTAVIVSASGDTCVVCGEYDRKTIEEMVVVTASGAEYLSTPQKELLLIHR